MQSYFDLENEKMEELKILLKYRLISLKEYLSFFSCVFYSRRDRRQFKRI